MGVGRPLAPGRHAPRSRPLSPDPGGWNAAGTATRLRVVAVVTWFLVGVATSLAGGVVLLSQGSLPLALLASVTVFAVGWRRLV